MWEQQSRSYIVIEYNDEVKGPSGISQYVNSLTEARTMELLWIPRHWRIMRNEAANDLARLEARLPFVCPQPAVEIFYAQIKEHFRLWGRK